MVQLFIECFVRISEQRADFVLYSIDWLGCITVVGSVHCAVRADSLYKADLYLVFKRLIRANFYKINSSIKYNNESVKYE